MDHTVGQLSLACPTEATRTVVSLLAGISHCRASIKRRGASGLPTHLAPVGQTGMQGM